jgi:hypothetical protein
MEVLLEKKGYRASRANRTLILMYPVGSGDATPGDWLGYRSKLGFADRPWE